jgi:hypothetical protein
MANPYWDGKVDKAVKFGDPFNPRTAEERKKRRKEVEALRVEERSWSFWGAILRRFGRG